MDRVSAETSQQPWTATRCHRLLRPLLAHVSALRKEKARRATVISHHDDTDPSDQDGASCATDGTTTNLRKRESGCQERRVRYKYSGKAARRRHRASQPQEDASSTTPRQPETTKKQQLRRPTTKPAAQEISLSTPFLRRVRNQPMSSPSRGVDDSPSRTTATTPTGSRCSSHPTCHRKPRCVFEQELAGVAAADAELHGLYESVFRALDALLRATCPRKNRVAAPKSLLAMCLRKVPDYVSGLEHWERKDAAADGRVSTLNGSRVSFEVYSELESLGVVDGWRNLCTVVRAHGIQIMREAVGENLLPDDVTELVIRLCAQYMPRTEYMALVDSYIFRPYPRPLSPDQSILHTPALQPLRILTLWDTSSMPSLRQGKLADLLARDLLPAEWVLTRDFGRLWVATTGLLAEKGPCQDAVDFLVVTIRILCGLVSTGRRKPTTGQNESQDRAQKMLVGTTAALASIVLLGEDEAAPKSAQQQLTNTRLVNLRKRVEHILRSCSDGLRDRRAEVQQLGTYMLSLCAFLAFGTASAAAMVEAAWGKTAHDVRANDGRARQYDATMVFVSSVAHCWSRGTHLPPNIYFSRLCDRLETLHLPGSPLSNIRVDGSFCLADQTGDLRDLAFAEALKSRNSTRTPCASFAGFRWDEGISEWVVLASPTPRSTSCPVAAAADLRLPARILRPKTQTASCSVRHHDEDEDESGPSSDDAIPVSPSPSSADPEDDHHQPAGPNVHVSDDETSEQQHHHYLLGHRRLRRPLVKPAAMPTGPDDELSLDETSDKENNHQHHMPGTKWLTRKRPARTSLLSLQPVRKRKSAVAVERYGDESSDDELSHLV
ncbi:hypothetical protein B0T19DRAFT_121025 [Cercophora scortea]|uniref:Uncharacterized protein n=1 Tax=Cercophora scortea TaxID=314031 RepID=A0AAE0IXW1_9PEZI|nr:hypothetical protein B0T19DRAFT_121025 [Cercophora scortea]